MRKLLLLAALMAAATPALAAKLPTDLAKAAHDYDLAQMNSDKAELTRLLADDYLLQNSGGHLQDKASFIADSTAPDFHIEPFVVEEPMEKLLGDTALLGGVATLKGADGGKAFGARLRFVDVWAKRDGKWRVVFTQVTRAPLG